MISIWPTLISSDILSLEQNIKKLEPYCQGFHLDIMDFSFVPKLEWSPAAINHIRRSTNKKIHVHLMVQYPEKYIPLLNLNPYDIVSVHIESASTISFQELLKSIQLKQLIPSIAINPYTPIESVISIQFPIEHVLIMSANLELSQPNFLPHSLEKVKQLNNFKKAHNLSFNISIDGEITMENLKAVAESGTNEVVMSSTIFGPNNHIDELKMLIHLTTKV